MLLRRSVVRPAAPFSDARRSGVVLKRLHQLVEFTAPALQNANSIAGLLLTTEAVVTEKPEPKGSASSMPSSGGMGDMYRGRCR
jgi:hypothetical protein